MAGKDNLRIQVTLPPFRMVWNHCFNGRKSDKANEKGEFDYDYGCMAVFDKPEKMTPTNRALYEAACAAAIKCKEHFFGAGYSHSKYEGPFMDGTQYNIDNEGKYPFLADKICMNLKSKNRPVGVRNGVPNINAPAPFVDPTGFYDGLWAIADGSFYCYDNKSVGMRFGMNNIMKVADDEPIITGNDPDKAFKDAGTTIDVSQFASRQGANGALLNSDRKEYSALVI